MHKMHTI